MKRGWLSLTTYMKLVSNLHDLEHSLGQPFDHDAGKAWAQHVKASALEIQTANLVMYDRHLSKINA